MSRLSFLYLRAFHSWRLLLVLTCLPLAAACVSPNPSIHDTRGHRPFFVELEAGSLTQGRNDVRIPGDSGTRFALDELIGDEDDAVGRLTVDYEIDDRHALRAVIAPLEVAGTGLLDQPSDFAGTTFAAGTPTRGTYQFSSYRLGYRYTFHQDEAWRLRVGGTLFVRDAEIVLQQGATRASDDDVGVVPLVNFAAEYTPSPDWRFVGEIDGLAASQGRAFDVSLKARYAMSETTSLGFGWRGIEGGVDNDDVFNFAFLHAIVVSIGVQF